MDLYCDHAGCPNGCTTRLAICESCAREKFRSLVEERDFQYTEAFMGEGARGTGPMSPQRAKLLIKEMVDLAVEEEKQKRGG